MADGARPVIGVTCFVRDASYADWSMNSAILPSTYTTAIRRAAGTPVIIPPSEDPGPLLDLIETASRVLGKKRLPAHAPESAHRRIHPARNVLERF